MKDAARLVREGAESLRTRNFGRHADAVEQTVADNARMRAALNEIIASVRLDWDERPDPDAGLVIKGLERIAKEGLA